MQAQRRLKLSATTARPEEPADESDISLLYYLRVGDIEIFTGHPPRQSDETTNPSRFPGIERRPRGLPGAARRGTGADFWRLLTAREVSFDYVAGFRQGDVVGYGAGAGFRQYGVGVASEHMLLELVFVFDA